MKEQKGVSLIALIVTIIVIIILVAVVIGMANNTPEAANRAKIASDMSEVQQAVSTKLSENYNQYITNPDTVDLNKGFRRVNVIGAPSSFESFPLEEGEEGTVQGYIVDLETINMERLPIGQGYDSVVEAEFGVSDTFIYDAKEEVYYTKGYRVGENLYYTKSDSTEEINKGVNPPKLGSGMTPVYWDSEGNEISKIDTRYNAKDWYDYAEQTGLTVAGGTSKWANAKTADGSYFVWIPRYAYKITYYTTATKTTVSATNTVYGDIDILFLSGTSSTKYIDKKTNTIKDLPLGYIVHPAFTNNTSLGGWDEELTGLWIGKFEASSSDATIASEGTSTIFKVVPSVKSKLIYIIGDMYDKGIEYNQQLNSHMIKNSEWGAVAYLTHSKYGRNTTEITKNGHTGKVTGYSGTTYAYNTDNGKLASTTGNIYGIYDMCGCAFEYVAAYDNVSLYGGLENNGGNLALENGVIKTTSTKYSTAYSGTNVSTDYIVGDATYETGNWNSDLYGFFNSTIGCNFVKRGGYSGSSVASAGIFSITFDDGTGGTGGTGYGLRICLIP
jgi:type II secretory pathway pseudopilin PulG